MFSLAELYTFMDPVLIWPYRLAPDAVAGFWLGTAVLSLYCVILGEFTMGLVYLVNRDYYQKLTKNMVGMHNTSIDAIRYKDKKSYKASNKWANEYFGRLFFSQMAFFATSLWPVPFALGWLSTRFSDITIHDISIVQLGYPFVLIASYILVRVAFSRIKRYVPFISYVHKLRLEDAGKSGKMKSWGELGQPEKENKTQAEPAEQA